ncbi:MULTISPECIES: GNAT family N-acetyltransferase [Vibrio]|uniref:GNAT family N-acetyltransferase n=1 Tax=Vibrio TaxID=662 RepID=UPI0011109E5E|nr:GNAT family N-acetyltransferase [Vibrio parahaemolyticus]MCR9731286.1 GNAT family N-acetyltransferase [Vibrio parahaemolyticus]MCR9751477.1 GNAT family N-acetyltransferase [Vibrio parahaemolyticus]MCR9788202.1 GNAT family N-acetyltransferase [Vibrio parahaemolyticus]MCR9860918.1 GNAT family N-acetyltransferase [Vibrio parahaemolyticus]MDF4880488.1 GNAT family N-acetyltransferase [Vibrio parahaemolyticus]
MVVLREMRQEEYPAYCQYFIDDYSREIAKNYGHTLEVATELATKELHRCFPNGLGGDVHSLLCIDTEIEGQLHLIGYLWHSVNASDRSTFIYDFFVSSEYRGLGYGTQAISELEKQLQSVGIKQIKLRVAYHNERALKLYKEVGFVITGFNMAKQIGEQ